ncbi:hypothetical protein BDR07DRAFT_1396981, partial [Suillus spraguei]
MSMSCNVSIHPERPPLFKVNNWWHSLSLSYQIEESRREPSIVTLNLRDGIREEDFPRKLEAKEARNCEATRRLEKEREEQRNRVE